MYIFCGIYKLVLKIDILYNEKNVWEVYLFFMFLMLFFVYSLFWRLLV